MKIKFTHRAWILLCPVFATAPDAEEGAMMSRHWALEPWMFINTLVFDLLLGAAKLVRIVKFDEYVDACYGYSHLPVPIEIDYEE